MVQHLYKNNLRFHQTPYGALPGVTTVLSNTKDYYSVKSLEDWRQKVGKTEADRIKQAASDRGNKLHYAIERYLDSKPYEMDETTTSLFNQVKPLLDTLVAHYIERSTIHSLGYAGSPDLIATYKGNLTIFDWKTSTKPKKGSYIKDYILQVCAYISSANETLGLNCDRGCIVVVTPGQPEAQLFHITPKQFYTGWEQFQERLKLFQSKYTELYF